jgi:hypothetical protein
MKKNNARRTKTTKKVEKIVHVLFIIAPLNLTLNNHLPSWWLLFKNPNLPYGPKIQM